MKLIRSKFLNLTAAACTLAICSAVLAAWLAVNLINKIELIQPAYAEPKTTSVSTIPVKDKMQSANRNADAVRSLLRTNPNNTDPGSPDTGNAQIEGQDQSGTQSDLQKAVEQIKQQKAHGGE